jgi:hypothetical protein
MIFSQPCVVPVTQSFESEWRETLGEVVHTPLLGETEVELEEVTQLRADDFLLGVWLGEGGRDLPDEG